MPTPLIVPLIVALIIGSALVTAATVCVVKARRLNKPIRIAAALAFAPVALFCMWGFAAAMEPGDYHVVWRVGYALVFAACLLAIARLAFAKPMTELINQD